MDMSKVVIYLVFLTLSFLNSAHAELDGKDLLRDCRFFIQWTEGADDSKLTVESGVYAYYCAGLVRGILSEMIVMKVLKDENYIKDTSPIGSPALFPCTPESVTTPQFVRITVKYLEDHPEFLHRSDSTLVRDAITEAFPCEVN